MPLLPHRLNTRIILVVSCILLATGVTSGWITARNQTASLLATMRLNSSILVRNFAESSAHQLLVQDYADLETFLLKSAELPDIRRLQICEPDGTLIWDVTRSRDGQPQAKAGIAHITPPVSRSAVIVTDNDHLVIWQPIMAGSLLGWLKADFSLSAIKEAQSRAWKHSLLLTMVWVVCSAVLIVLVLRPLVRSISRLTAFAKQLDEQKGTQILITGQPLEIAELGDSLNEASTKLLSTEQQLLSEREQLRNSESRYRLLVENSPMCIHEIDMDGRISSMNKAGLIMMGVKEECTVQGVFYLDAVCDADRKRIEDLLAKAYAGEASNFEFMASGPGRLIFKSCFVPIKDQNNRVEKLMGITEDITEQQLAQDEILNLNADLELRVQDRTARLNETINELEAFSYSVSHDLRSPLRSIDGFSQAILDDYSEKLDQQGKDYLRRVRAACQRMSGLIDDMLKLSRVTRSVLTRESVDLSALAHSVTDELRRTEPERGVEFIIQEDLNAEGDPQLLRVVLENLFGNAWKFTSQQDRAKIEFGVTVTDDGTEYVVRDDGAGFDMTYAEKLFVPFQRLHAYNDFAGTGIGLSIVQRIIRRHGGNIRAEGSTGAGAAFYFTLQ